ncbi:PIN domain-containing protein [Methanimicrococcus blatticola]|uniref:N-acetyltransferase domain-containing protein n=1 Tax=Methanimicrococcus blatticola TaxID=91560 RepID=A0A484F4Q8_9EURY|nr:PIN domain-containing protein [Methanimicrococcus blatticola]MBZ3935729.1 hypothetical protein [Methanimicrococcus blatticola]MCC2508151.1 hypothetical protein [Methanimicrococcus blatticola]TDQ68772.1 hypothetical protein C7391_0967 [Methanimicrococcus blatticola]
MRVLLDTNIIIYRENKKVTNYSVTHLFRWLDKLKYDKLIHPLSRKEIERYITADPAESMTLKLDAYDELKTVAPLDIKVEELSRTTDKNDNDKIDTALLNEVYLGRVDLLVTEDRKLQRKAITLGIPQKVVSINTFISNATAENPTLVEYNTLAVKKGYFGSIDINNSFFDSFKEDYDGFASWFAKKCDEEAYICQDGTDRILGFLYLKTETEDENYSDIIPSFSKKRRLKVGTFKVESTGFRLGERFIKIILDNALERNVDEVYVTLFDDREELIALGQLFLRWGFVRFGSKIHTDGRNEIVLTKNMTNYDSVLSPKQNYPNLRYNVNKFIMPIDPKYHTSLFPDSILNTENENDFLENTPYRYALQKVYITWGQDDNVNPGDVMLFYRMGPEGSKKRFSSVITTVAIVDEILDTFSTKEEFLNQCQNRSVFSIDDLELFWQNYRNNIKIMKFVYVKSLVHRPVLDFLWKNNIIPFPKGPRPFTHITNDQFNLIINEGRTDLSRFWRLNI